MPVDKKYADFLEELRKSGATNMWGAQPYLMTEFPELDEQQAEAILLQWIKEKRR